MVKIGPAFSDYVTHDRGGRRRETAKSPSSEIINSLPLFILVTCLSILLIRLFFLQVVRGAYYRNLSEGNRTKTKVIYAERGIIQDRNGKSLVRNIPAFKTIENGKTSWIEKDKALSEIAKNPESKISIDTQREYLYKDAFSHVLGYTGQIDKQELLANSDYSSGSFVGKIGLEKEYEGILRGQDGKELFEVNSQGATIRKLGTEEAISGNNLKTTLDLDLQLAAADAMSGVKKGAVIISDPRSGAILAIYSKPSFDPNLFTHPKEYVADSSYKSVESILTDNSSQPMLDRAVSGAYPPGSTFKLITAAAGLETGAILRDTKIEDTGVLKAGDFSYANWYFTSYGKTEGFLDVIGALKRSNDIFFYKTAELTGASKIIEMGKKFGLGERLGIDLGGEAGGTLGGPSWKKEKIGETWYLGDTYHLGIGQGYLLTTPLQVNFWTTVFANEGTLYRPHLISGKKEVLRDNFIKKENIDFIREGMKESCITGGVAWPLFDFKVANQNLTIDDMDYFQSASDGAKMVRVALACKTGTAETYKNEDPHAWITVFAPFYNPEIVVTVLVENGGEGSNVAGPIAKKILEKYFGGK